MVSEEEMGWKGGFSRAALDSQKMRAVALERPEQTLQECRGSSNIG